MNHAAKDAPLLHDALDEAARLRPDHVGLVCDGQRLTWAELNQRSNALANTLEQRGVVRGDRVMIFGDNVVETVIAFWGGLKANAVVSVVNPQTRAGKIEYLLGDARPSALISEARLHPHFAEPARTCPHLRTTLVSGNLESVDLERLPGGLAFETAIAAGNPEAPPRRRCIDIDLASIIYTSGSTGEPKGVMHTHRSMRVAAASITTYLENDPSDVILGVLPLSFDYGLYQMIMAAWIGGRLVLERSFAYPAQIFDRIEEERVTGFPGVPTMFAMMADMPGLASRDLRSIRYFTSTAAALSVKHIDHLRRLCPDARVYSMYGLTECKRVSYLPPEDLERKPTSVGIPIPNTEVWVVDEEGRRLPAGQVGQLVVRGGTVMLGYWEKPEATDRKLKPGLLPGERVLYTGDYAWIDEEGYLYFVGRMDDIIKCRGEKVAPREVEDVLERLPGIREAAVVGVPDPVLGQAVKAFVVPNDGVTLEPRAIQRACMRYLESYSVPKEIVVVDDLPRTITGKIKKTELR